MHTVYCINPACDLKNDYRLISLKKNGVKVDYIFNHFDHALGLRHRIRRFFYFKYLSLSRFILSIKKIQYFNIIDKLNLWLQRRGNRLYIRTIKRYYNIQWAKGVIKQSGAKVLCFDWVLSSSRRGKVVSSLVKAAKEMFIPVISLPHGVYLYTNDYIKHNSSTKMRFENLRYLILL